MERRRVIAYIVNAFPIWGSFLYVPFLAWLAGPTYTTAPNQGAMVFLLLGYMAWLVLTGLVIIITTIVVGKPRWKVFLFGFLCWGVSFFMTLEMLKATT